MSSNATPAVNHLKNVVKTIIESGDQIDPRSSMGSMLNEETKLAKAVQMAQLRLNTRTSSIHLMQVDQDDEERHVKMTFSRRLVKKCLVKIRYYYTKQPDDPDNENRASLLNAWAFFEHYTLPRYRMRNGGKVRVVPGDEEHESQLYPVWGTKESELHSWGVGVRLYFHLLKKLSFLFLLVGMINIPTIIYYGKPEYSTRQDIQLEDLVSSNVTKLFIDFLISGSAVCNKYEFVNCSNCSEKESYFEGRTMSQDNFTLYRHNSCEMITKQNIIINWTSHIFIIIGFFILNYEQDMQEKRADEQKISSSDYSIMVKNPPKKAFDPDIWRDFFSKFDQSSPPLVTIALDNEELLSALAQLRNYRWKLQCYLKCEGENSEDVLERKLLEMEKDREERNDLFSFFKTLCKPFGLFLDGADILSKLQYHQLQVKTLLKKEYYVSKVFITMETETGQRTALDALDVARLQNCRNVIDDANPKFQEKILYVQEAREATAVRWEDLSVPTINKFLQKMLTWIMTIAIMVALAFIVRSVENTGHSIAAALVISFGNIIFPHVLLFLTTNVERHASAGARQLSMYLKVTIFRWVNTVFLILIFTPTTKVLSGDSGDLLPSVAPIFFFELLLAPLIRVFDLIGLLKKHILAPRATSQKEMNSHFLGTEYNLAERYTDLTKMMLLCLFYSPIFPASFLIGGVALVVQYWADKFCLLRVWSIGADVGPQVGIVNKQIFLRLALLVYVFMVAYFWSGLPFDNLCKNEDGVNEWFYCDQNRLFFKKSIFPPLEMIQPKEKAPWMDEEQRRILVVYGILSFVVFLWFLASLLYFLLRRFVMPLLTRTYKDDTKNQEQDFSSLKHKTDVLAYIPQINIPGFIFPNFACDLSSVKMEPKYISWGENEKNKYDDYNLVNDPFLLDIDVDDIDVDDISDVTGPKFSIVKYWPSSET